MTTTDDATPFALHVECYAGGRGEETPRAVHLGGQRHAVAEVIDRWDDAGVTHDRGVRRIFKVRLDTGQVLLIEQDVGTHAWNLRGYGLGVPTPPTPHDPDAGRSRG